ncbi:S-methyl-5'-thioadenosine phosphorylase [Bacteriovorax sp. DB6_IX]|uniref:S-methyl-5'-thioadenosine phosphorylase n=1 Tax=Bacteriovorax sp. DB6_IX TaxID=1353530 RepID=UPI000389DC49|nr:S-methyl-5'-thioadenosine phosphorylase [Bacteriovorax sp. DB6_IX]EQC50077.1 methylthioadenosine phosphorylase [Bacteriovorax sp. DB6_IX]
MNKLGVIGGSGIYSLENIKIVAEHNVETPFGKPSDMVIQAEVNGAEVYFMPRHGRAHSILPHEVNYRANIFALKSLGVDVIVSVSAVGSLKEEHAPTDFVLPDQFIDWTKGKRERSFFGNGIVAHVSTAYPVNGTLQERIHKTCRELDIKAHKGGTYICIEGPQFSSRAESELYRNFGADVIGMTNVPESYLAKEAGIAYSTIAMITDYDCWKEEHVDVESVMGVMKKNNETIQRLVMELVPELVNNPIEFEKENAIGVMTPENLWSQEQKEWMKVLLK